MSYSSARGDAFATVSAAIASHPGYPVLVLGASDSGRSILVNMIREKGPFMQVKLYEEPPEEPVVFKAVWIVADYYYTCEQIQKTIEIIRDVKENAEKYGVTDDTRWVSVATDGAEAIASAIEKKRINKMFDMLKEKMEWVPDGKLLTKTIDLMEDYGDYDKVNELVNMVLSKKHLRMLEDVCMRRGDGPMENIDEVPFYNILILGDADSGGHHIIDMINYEYNGYGPAYVTCPHHYDKVTKPPDEPYTSVCVVVGYHYSDEQVSKTIEYIRSVKENPDKYPLSKNAQWILVATNAEAAAPDSDDPSDAETSDDGKTYNPLFEQLEGELAWVSEKNRYQQKISLKSGGYISELIDIALPVPHMYKTQIFQDPDYYNDAKSIASNIVKAMLEVSSYQNVGFKVVLKKSAGHTEVIYT